VLDRNDKQIDDRSEGRDDPKADHLGEPILIEVSLSLEEEEEEEKSWILNCRARHQSY
jgi:hypothetical protein